MVVKEREATLFPAHKGKGTEKKARKKSGNHTGALPPQGREKTSSGGKPARKTGIQGDERKRGGRRGEVEKNAERGWKTA